MLADFIAFLTNSLTITILVAYVFALWAAIVAWTWIDIAGRTDNLLYRLGAILVVATGAILGFAIYLLLRPNMTKDEAQLRELEEAILASQAHWQACPKCNYVVRDDFAYCTNCSEKLATECSSCREKINVTWNVCPFCGESQKKLEVKEVVQVPARIGLRERGAVLFSGISSFVKKINVNKDLKKSKVRTYRAKGRKGAKTAKDQAA
jgi:RNA polymerase subunit RPABC4/transcription elongation factor Spt4